MTDEGEKETLHGLEGGQLSHHVSPQSTGIPPSQTHDHLPQYLHSDLVLPGRHALQAIVRAAAAAALHGHTAGYQLLGHSAHELQS